jgi:hypothetical protein
MFCCDLADSLCVVHFCLQLVRLPLAAAGPEVRMVESLAPMWAEERGRCDGGAIPDPAGSPPRSPRTLSHAVDAVRQQFAGIAAQQHQDRQPQQDTEAGCRQQHQQPLPPPQQQHMASTPGVPPAAPAGTWEGTTPAAAVMPSPAVHGTPLLALTQAANQAVLAQHPSPLLFPVPPAASQEWLQQHQPPVAGEQTSGTPAFELLQQQRQQPGWPAGSSILVDEQLLMTQLTEQHRQRQQQQQHDEPMAKQLSLDADAQAWLQVRDPLLYYAHIWVASEAQCRRAFVPPAAHNTSLLPFCPALTTDAS